MRKAGWCLTPGQTVELRLELKSSVPNLRATFGTHPASHLLGQCLVLLGTASYWGQKDPGI